MPKTSEELLREALDLFWKALKEAQKDNLPDVVKKYSIEARNGLNRAEELLRAGKVKEASDIAIQAGNILKGIDLRHSIECFRSANKIDQETSGASEKNKKFFEKASKILDHAEQLLSEHKFEEARLTLQEYHHQKVAVFWPPIDYPGGW